MSKIIQYVTIRSGQINLLDEKVTKSIADGFQPYGSPYTFQKILGGSTSDVQFYQAMVKYWRVVRSCSFFQFETIGIAASVEADFGGEEFLEDCAIVWTREKFGPAMAQRLG